MTPLALVRSDPPYPPSVDIPVLRADGSCGFICVPEEFAEALQHDFWASGLTITDGGVSEPLVIRRHLLKTADEIKADLRASAALDRLLKDYVEGP